MIMQVVEKRCPFAKHIARGNGGQARGNRIEDIKVYGMNTYHTHCILTFPLNRDARAELMRQSSWRKKEEDFRLLLLLRLLE